MKKIFIFIFIFLLLTLMSLSCATVKPWEKEYLADPIMSFDDEQTNNLTTNIEEIRESSAGGEEGNGGGCGCN